MRSFPAVSGGSKRNGSLRDRTAQACDAHFDANSAWTVESRSSRGEKGIHEARNGSTGGSKRNAEALHGQESREEGQGKNNW